MLVLRLLPVLARRLRGRPIDRLELARSMRGLLESMGLTYVKLGQFLATRYDLLPREVCDELGRLFQRVEPMPTADVLTQIERGLGKPAAALFSEIDPTPLGSASVAQVHRARRMDGEWVAVKVQRIGVRRSFTADIRSLRRLARLVAFLRLEVGFDVRAAVDEFAAFTGRELDFRVEAATAQRVRAQGDRTIVVPAVHLDATCETVLTLELVDGYSLSEFYAAIDRGEPARPGLASAAETLAQALFRQMFLEGFFHGDPHPGNVMLTRDGRVALVDYGIFGELDGRQLADVANYVEQLASGDVVRAYEHYARMVVPTRWSDMEGFRREAIEVLVNWRQAADDPRSPKSETQISTVSDRLLRVLRQNRVALRLDTLLFWRAVILLDANFARPELSFDLNRSLRTFFERNGASPQQRIFAALMRPSLLGEHWALRMGLTGHAAGILRRDPEARIVSAKSGAADEPTRVVAAALVVGAAGFLGLLWML
jgi:ubiquinone biosynthesis protein